MKVFLPASNRVVRLILIIERGIKTSGQFASEKDKRALPWGFSAEEQATIRDIGNMGGKSLRVCTGCHTTNG